MILYVLIGSALAISALVALNHVLGGWTPARIEDLKQAAQRLNTDFIGFDAGEGVIAADGGAALVEEAGAGRIALVVAQGDIWITRKLGPADVRAVTAGDDGVLDMRLNDFTLPRVRIAFDNAGAARDWAQRLSAMSGP